MKCRIILVFLTLFFLHFSATISAMENQVEVFDCHKEAVIHKLELTKDIQRIVINYVDDMTTPFKNFNPLPSHGLMIKVPIEQPLTVSHNYFTGVVGEVIVILPTNENPYLLLLDDENYPHFYYFKGDIAELLDKVGISYPTH